MLIIDLARRCYAWRRVGDPARRYAPFEPMTPVEASILTGLKRCVNSAKCQVSFYGLTAAWFAIKFGTNDLAPADKSHLWLAFFISVGVCLREIVNAWGAEDAAKAQAPLPAAPAVQVNTGGDNTQSNAPAAVATSSPPAVTTPVVPPPPPPRVPYHRTPLP